MLDQPTPTQGPREAEKIKVLKKRDYVSPGRNRWTLSLNFILLIGLIIKEATV